MVIDIERAIGTSEARVYGPKIAIEIEIEIPSAAVTKEINSKEQRARRIELQDLVYSRKRVYLSSPLLLMS